MLVHPSEPLYLGPDGSNWAGVPSTDTKWIWYMVPFRVVDLVWRCFGFVQARGVSGLGGTGRGGSAAGLTPVFISPTELHPELPGPADWELSELLHGLTHGHGL